MSSVNTVQPKNNPELTFLFALSLFALFFDVHVRRGVGGGIRSGFVDASLTSQRGGRQQAGAHTQEKGCCLSWQPLRRPRGPWLVVNPQLVWEPTGWGKSRNRQWKLNYLSSFPSSLLVLLLFPRVRWGKLYRPKGRLTSLEPWNGSDSLPGVGVRATVIHCALRWKADALSDFLVLVFFFFF